MTLTMLEEQALTEVSALLYSYLPASGAAYTFGEAARDAGVGDLWPGVGRGLSKGPALTELLQRTLSTRRDRFCSLIEQIVRNGLSYRGRKGAPVMRTDIEKLNSALVKVGFKIPDLWNRKFLESLPSPPGAGASPAAPRQTPTEQVPEVRPQLDLLKTSFLDLNDMRDRQKAGLKLESLLNHLFALFSLEPSRPFRIVGEQIDGAFALDSAVYLVEAKWMKEPVNAANLYTLRVKIEGKSQFTRGLFLSINGFSSEAVDAITRGKSPNFIMMDGSHLYRVLDGYLPLDTLLRRLVRHVAETGEPYLPVNRL
jgi:hypothetical protein